MNVFKNVKNKPLPSSDFLTMTRNGFGQDFIGDMRVGQGVFIDGKNKRIIVNDGSNDRILIGYQQGGF